MGGPPPPNQPIRGPGPWMRGPPPPNQPIRGPGPWMGGPPPPNQPIRGPGPWMGGPPPPNQPIRGPGPWMGGPPPPNHLGPPPAGDMTLNPNERSGTDFPQTQEPEGILCCGKCGFKTLAGQEFSYHQRNCRSGVSIQCSWCKLSFSSRKYFLNHKEEAHALDIKKSEASEATFAKVSECNDCKESFPTKEDMWIHQAKHHALSKKVLKCQKCHFVTVDASHLASHEAQCGIFCDICNGEFESKEETWTHKASVHASQVTVLSCGQPCDFVTVSSSHLEQHLSECAQAAVRMTDWTNSWIESPAVKPTTKVLHLQCAKNCGFETAVLEELHEHEQSCGSMFECTVCMSMLKSEEDMWVHLAKEHKEMVDVMRCVTACDFVTVTKSHLKEHVESCTKAQQYQKDIEALAALMK